jgi:hypothetical protein
MGVMKLEIVLEYSHSNQFSIGILVGTFGEGAGRSMGLQDTLLGCLRGQSGVQVPLTPTGRWMSF